MKNDSAGPDSTESPKSSSLPTAEPKGSPQALRYQAEIASIANCSKSATAPFSGPLYRGIKGEAATSGDFLPHAILYPGLYESTPIAKRCPFWSLSMFESPTQMFQRFAAVERTSRKYKKLTGMYCARLDLASTDGIRTHANSEGHVEFFPYETFDGVKAVVDTQPPAT